MEYIECEPIQGVGYCLDNDCPCTVTEIPEGTGYLYISPEVVEFRKDALTQAEVKRKLAPIIEKGENVSVSKYEPILICELGAKKRHLDLNIAAEDARHRWKTNMAPLRPTPLTFEEDQNDSFIPEQITTEPAEGSDSSSENEAIASFVDKNIREQPKVELDMVSAEDVASQYAGTPLAEMAAKMVEQESPDAEQEYPEVEQESSHVDELATTDTAIPQDTLYRDYSDSSEGDESRKKRSRKKKKPLILILVVVFSLLILVNLILFLFKFLNAPSPTPRKRQVTTTVKAKKKIEKIAEEPKKELAVKKELTEDKKVKEKPAVTGLTRIFFNSAYLFKDNQYHGNIRFLNVTSQNGTYRQDVQAIGKDKVYHVTGSFRYTKKQIVFTPEGANVDVAWRVQSLNLDQGKAVFFDPKKGNSAEARIYLTACKSADCK